MTRARVLLLNPALGPLDYRVPHGMAVEPCSIVLAPLGPRPMVGEVWEEIFPRKISTDHELITVFTDTTTKTTFSSRSLKPRKHQESLRTTAYMSNGEQESLDGTLTTSLEVT